MAGELNGAQVAFLMANEGVEQVELTGPMKAVEDAEGVPVLIAPKTGEIQAFNHFQRGDVFPATLGAADASPDAYVGLVLPGGVANPDRLRMDDDSVALVRSFFGAMSERLKEYRTKRDFERTADEVAES